MFIQIGKALLNKAQNPDMQLQTTAPEHISHGEPSGTKGMKYRNPFNTSFDGNTVEIGVEQAFTRGAVALRRFRQASDDQTATLFGVNDGLGWSSGVYSVAAVGAMVRSSYHADQQAHSVASHL